MNEELIKICSRHRYLRNLRPMMLAEAAKRLLNQDRRVFATTRYGTAVHVDPLSNLGFVLAETGSYEDATAAMLRRHLRDGGAFLDVGAGEGVLSAYAAGLVGPTGLVIAVEPQSRLQPVIEANMRLNGRSNYRLFRRALSNNGGEEARLNLYPSLNPGGSSLVRRYRFSWQHETVRTITAAELLEAAGIDRLGAVKIDVEGYEPEAVEALLPLCRAGRVGAVFVDYHAAILAARGADPVTADRRLAEAGMSREDGDPVRGGYATYVNARVSH